MTILFGGISAVLGMLALNGLPMPYHPVFNVPRFAMATKDRFFLIVFSTDAKYDRAGTRQFLESLGAAFHFGGAELMRDSPKVGSDHAGPDCVIAGCRLDMHVQPRQNPLAKSEFFADQRSRAPVVEGTVARGQLHEDTYFYTGKMGNNPGDYMPFAVTRG